MSRGYFGIGIYQCKTGSNIGTLWRSAFNFGAGYIFTIGKRYKKQASDTVCTYRHIPFFEFQDWEHFHKSIPYDCRVIALEQTENAKPLSAFTHPERAIYLLGAEDGGVPKEILNHCWQTVFIDTPFSLNVAVAGSIVLYDRQIKNKGTLE